MARPKKVVEETVEEVVQEVVQETPVEPKAKFAKTVLMKRSDDYPEPRTAEVHLEEVAEWEKYGWVKA